MPRRPKQTPSEAFASIDIGAALQLPDAALQLPDRERADVFFAALGGQIAALPKNLQGERARRLMNSLRLAQTISEPAQRTYAVFFANALGLPEGFCAPRILLRHRHVGLELFHSPPKSARNTAHLRLWLEERFGTWIAQLDADLCTCAAVRAPDRAFPEQLLLCKTAVRLTLVALAHYHRRPVATMRREINEALKHRGRPQRMIDSYGPRALRAWLEVLTTRRSG